MKKNLLMIFLLFLTACKSTERPIPDVVVNFSGMPFNNSPLLMKEFEASRRLLLVAVSKKDSVVQSSKDLESLLGHFADKQDVFLAYRVTNLVGENRNIEIYDVSDTDVPKVLSNINKYSLVNFGHWFGESEFKSFSSSFFNKNITVANHKSVVSQLEDLIGSVGWTLDVSDDFLKFDGTDYDVVNMDFKVILAGIDFASYSDVKDILEAWSTFYEDVNTNYDFDIDVGSGVVSYSRVK